MGLRAIKEDEEALYCVYVLYGEDEEVEVVSFLSGSL